MVFTRPKSPTSSRPSTIGTGMRIAQAPGQTSPSACATGSASACTNETAGARRHEPAERPRRFARNAALVGGARAAGAGAVDLPGPQRAPPHPARCRDGVRRALRQRGVALSFANRAGPLDGQLRVRHLRLRVDLGDDPRRHRRPRARRRHHPLRAAIPRERPAGAAARRRARGAARGAQPRNLDCR